MVGSFLIESRRDRVMVYLYKASLITTARVIPAKAGIHERTGFRVKPGMTKCIRLMSSCIFP
jgi:hypothetical protein